MLEKIPNKLTKYNAAVCLEGYFQIYLSTLTKIHTHTHTHIHSHTHTYTHSHTYLHTHTHTHTKYTKTHIFLHKMARMGKFHIYPLSFLFPPFHLKQYSTSLSISISLAFRHTLLRCSTISNEYFCLALGVEFSPL